MAKKNAKRSKSSPKRIGVPKHAPEDQRQSLVDLVAVSELVGVRLEECAAARDETPTEGEERPKSVVDIGLASQYEEPDEKPPRMLFRVTFSAVATPRNRAPTLRVVATFLSIYNIRPGSPRPQPEVVESFGQEVGMFAVWPYWREFANSVANRMGLPALPIGLLKRDSLGEWKRPPEGEMADAEPL